MPSKKKQLPQKKPVYDEKKKKVFRKRDLKREKILEEIGSSGGDPRLVGDETVTPQAMVYKDSVEAILSRPQLVQQSYWTPLLAILSDAFSKGFMASGQQQLDPFAPYYAFVYLVKAIESAVNDSDPPMTNAPLWFALWYQFMRPGKIKFRTGTIDYKFNTDDTGDTGFGVTPMSQIPWFAPNTRWVFGSVAGDGTNVNGYLVLLSPPSYTQELGANSWNLLTQYFANTKRYPMWNMVPLTDPIFRSYDPSAYAAGFAEVGAVLGSSTGIVTELFSEVFIQSPIMGVFSAYEEIIFRTFSHVRQFGGGGCYMGGRIQELQKPGEIHNKVRPTFKLIDFNEFYEVCALWLAGALALASTNVLQEQDALIVPMTVQDFRILLRQAIMSMFQDSQAMAQDLLYQGVDQFFPFLVSTGCCGKSVANSMTLPIILVENLRALLRRTIRAKTINGRGVGQMVDFIPVWGMWAGDIPQVTNYQYTNTVGFTGPVFTTESGEMTIDLIDGSALVGSPPNYTPLDLNGGELSTLVTDWNTFLSTTLSANVTTLSPIGSELGISALEVLTMSELLIPVPLPPPPEAVPNPNITLTNKPILGKINSEKKLKHYGRPPRVRNRVGADNGPIGGSVNSPYSTWSTNFVCSNQKVVANAWSECQIYWILPTSRTTGSRSNTQNYAAYQSQNSEPHSFFLGASGTSDGIISPIGETTTYQRHQNYASQMVSAVAAKTNALEDFLVHAAATGRGGFLGKLVGGLVGGIVGQGELGAEIGNDWL